MDQAQVRLSLSLYPFDQFSSGQISTIPKLDMIPSKGPSCFMGQIAFYPRIGELVNYLAQIDVKGAVTQGQRLHQVDVNQLLQLNGPQTSSA